jgi:hypothetical protein
MLFNFERVHPVEFILMYWIYLLPSTQQTIGYNGFITTCFDSHESPSGYVQNLSVLAVLLLTVSCSGGCWSVWSGGWPYTDMNENCNQQPPEQETIRGNPRRSSDTSRRAQKPMLLYSFVSKILYITIRCVWIVRRLDKFYAVPHYYKYRKLKRSASETSELKRVSYVKLTLYWNIKRLS